MVKVKPVSKKYSAAERKAFLNTSSSPRSGTNGSLGATLGGSLAGSLGGVKKSHRFKPGTVALREIKREQRRVEPCIPKAAIQRLIREILQQVALGGDMKIQKSAVMALQEAAENKLVETFEDSQLLAIHANRTTVKAEDMQKVMRIKQGRI